MKVLVLAGGADQIALINELKKRGHYIVLADYFTNPPAKSYADRHIVASTLDVEAIRRIASDEKVDLVTTACTDQALLTVAKVSEDLSLPCYITYQKGLNVTNKSYMKNVLLQNNIPTARFIILNKVDTDAIRDFTFPLVVKPVDCNSSKGVRKVETIEDLPLYLKAAIECSRTKTAIVEEYKQGMEISADFYVEGTKAKFLCATSSAKINNKDSFTILSSDYPAISKEQEEIITSIGNRIAQVFDLKDCPLFIQLIVNKKDVSIIEFSARMGGGSKYNLINVLSGVNIMEKYVERILGGRPSVNPSKKMNYCKMVYIYCTPGIFDHIEGFEELKRQNVIKDYFQYKTSGMEITKAETSGDRPAGYLVVADTLNELNSKVQFANSSVKIISSNGDDIMMHNLI